MKRYILSTVISTLAVILAMVHLIFPNLEIDAVTITLFVVATLPWLAPIFRSVELPGGLKVEFRDLEKAEEDAEKAGLLAATSERTEEPAYVSVAEEDPNLALAGLRIEIERRLKDMAKARGLDHERLGVGQLLRLLRTHQVIQPEESAVLSDLIPLLNNAVHGAEIEPLASRWAIDVGPRLLAGLDKRAASS